MEKSKIENLKKNKDKDMKTSEITKAVQGFINLIILGWETDLALKCCYDGVYDIIDSDTFINLCQNELEQTAKNLNNTRGKKT